MVDRITSSPRTRLAGRVANAFSSYLSVIAVDGALASHWPGRDSREIASWAGIGSSLEFDMGGCGTSDIFFLADDEIVLIEHYADDWNPELEQQFLRVVESPLASNAERLGTLEITSQVLAILHAFDDARELEIRSAIALGSSTEVSFGTLLGVPNGRYEIFREKLEIEGEWGTIASRVRLVHERSTNRARTTTTSIRPQVPVSAAQPARRLPLPNDMGFVHSLKVSDSWVVAGEEGGPNIAVWSADTGTMRWSCELSERATNAVYAQYVSLDIHDGHIAATVDDRLVVLDVTSGEVLAEHCLGQQASPFSRMIGNSSSFVRFTPDGMHLLVGRLPFVSLIEWRTGREIAAIEGMSSVYDAHFTSDGSTIAFPGRSIALYDSLTHNLTADIALEHYATASAVSPDGLRLMVADNRGILMLVDVTSQVLTQFHGALSAIQSVSVDALDWSSDGEQIAAASADGYVRIWNISTGRLVIELPGHDTTIPGTGARSLSGLCFSNDGRALFVGDAHELSVYENLTSQKASGPSPGRTRRSRVRRGNT